MKNIISLFTVLLLAFSLAACQKSNTEDNNIDQDNAFVIKPANGLQTVVYPIGSVFRRSTELSMWTGIHYSFFQDEYDTYPRYDNPFIVITGRTPKGEELTHSLKWINGITIQGLLPSLKLGKSLSIPLEEGQYKGGEELIKEVLIESFCSPDIHIVITSAAGDILTIRYSGAVQ